MFPVAVTFPVVMFAVFFVPVIALVIAPMATTVRTFVIPPMVIASMAAMRAVMAVVTAGALGSHGFDLDVDLHRAGLLKLERHGEGFPLFQGFLEAQKHEVVAAWFENDAAAHRQIHAIHRPHAGDAVGDDVAVDLHRPGALGCAADQPVTLGAGILNFHVYRAGPRRPCRCPCPDLLDRQAVMPGMVAVRFVTGVSRGGKEEEKAREGKGHEAHDTLQRSSQGGVRLVYWCRRAAG